jgi:hypothetical protein
MVACRPLSVDGRRYVTGGRFCADGDAAQQMLRSGQARLADDADLPRLLRVLQPLPDRPADRLVTR